MAHQFVCVSKGSWAIRWPSTLCASSWSKVLRTSAAAKVVTGKIRVTNGMPAYEGPPLWLWPRPHGRGEVTRAARGALASQLLWHRDRTPPLTAQAKGAYA